MRSYLNGIWNLKSDDGKYMLKAEVPGDVFSALVDSHISPHPYIGTNELLFRELEKRSWIYERDFELDDKGPHSDLVFEGIDTFAEIYLNDVYLGRTEDMFLEYRFDVQDVLKIGKNTLRVVIESPRSVGERLENTYGRLNATEATFRVYIRKAQYSFGWDWGPRLPTSGIWKDVYLEFHRGSRLFGSTAYVLDMKGPVHVEGYVLGNVSEDMKVKVFANGDEVGEFGVFKLSEGSGKFEGTFKRDLPLWYPLGLGKPRTNEFVFKLIRGEETLYTEIKKIGLRTVEIIQERDDEGITFTFSINGQRVFVKGANWIPVDVLYGWVKKKDYEELIDLAVKANMNMIRVWGGGVFEREDFYDICDEKGLMIWHDFMFACGEYPDHLGWFRELVNDEIRQNVVRLRHHPSIVLWCGNNENNLGFAEWNFNTKVDGVNLGNRLYLEDFPEICAEEDPSTPYWPSSPYGGQKPNSENTGDIHVWNVWSGWRDFREYEKIKGKFISEFGFQSAPTRETLRFALRGDDLFSEEFLHHNKQVEGMERIIKFINSEYGLVCDLEKIIYLSQLIQAEAIKTGVEHWRSRKYRTSGTLYWQLNDVWPVFSWSALDYFKRKKALYYYSKRFYAPVLPVVARNAIHVINDTQEHLNGILTVELWKADGDLMWKKEYHVEIPPDSVLHVGDLPEEDADLVHMTLKTPNGAVENHKTLKKFRNMTFKDPNLRWSVEKNILKIRTERPAIGVHIENCDTEDDFLTIFPGYDVSLKISCEDVERISITYLT